MLFGTTAGLLGMSVLLSQVNGLTAALGMDISLNYCINYNDIYEIDRGKFPKGKIASKV